MKDAIDLFLKNKSVFKENNKFYKVKAVSDTAFSSKKVLNKLKEKFPNYSVNYMYLPKYKKVVFVFSEEVKQSRNKNFSESLELSFHSLIKLNKKIKLIQIKDFFIDEKEFSFELTKEEFYQYVDNFQDSLSILENEIDNFLYNKLKKEIISAAEKNGGFIDIEGENLIYKVPKLPFYYWAINARFFNDLPQKIGLDKWAPVSPYGFKMQNDDPYHTDWWIGAGIPIKSYNEEEDEKLNMNAMMLKINLQAKLLNFESTVLSGNEDVVAYVQHYDDFKNDFSKVLEDRILILPDLNLKFESIILKAVKNGKGGVVCGAGGKAAHLSKVGRELNFPIFLEDNALNKFKNVMKLKLSPKSGKITWFNGSNLF